MHQKIAIGLLFFLATTARGVPDPSTQPTTSPQIQAVSQPVDDPPAPSRVVAVTVYQGTALVTREVQVKDGNGLMELTVNPLPPETVDSSLYTESTDGIRVLSTRYRTARSRKTPARPFE